MTELKDKGVIDYRSEGNFGSYKLNQAELPLKISFMLFFRKEKNLKDIDKVKFLVPQELTVSQLANILRLVSCPSGVDCNTPSQHSEISFLSLRS